MAEGGVPQFKNKGLLLVAVVLGGVVVIIYNVHINKVRTSLEGKQVRLLKYARAIGAGEKIDRRDLRVESIRKDDASALGSVVQQESQSFVINRRLRQAVNMDEWVQWPHVTGNVRSPSIRISVGMVGVPVDLDPRMSPGALCSPGDRVNILGSFQITPEAPPRILRIIRNVEVLQTGTSAVMGAADESERRSVRSYRSISIEVSEEVSPKLKTLLNMCKNSAWLEVLPPNEVFDPSKHGIINPDEPLLKQLLQAGGISG